MGMGYGSNFADVISSDDLKAFCPDEHCQLIAALDKHDVSFETFCQESEEMNDEILFAFGKLIGSFKYKTGLMLETGYHSCEDEGDKYDEVDGGFWQVDGMYELTEAGKKIGDKVERKFFVTFG